MRYTFRPSFDRSIKSLHPNQKNELRSLCLAFLELLESRSAIPAGMGLKRLREDSPLVDDLHDLSSRKQDEPARMPPAEPLEEQGD